MMTYVNDGRKFCMHIVILCASAKHDFKLGGWSMVVRVSSDISDDFFVLSTFIVLRDYILISLVSVLKSYQSIITALLCTDSYYAIYLTTLIILL